MMTAQLVNYKEQCKYTEGKRILLIEDHDVNRMFMSDYLHCCGYNVKALAEGLDFFIIIEQFQPELILLDLKLPDVDGYTLLEKKQRGDYIDIPVIVVSAFAFRADKERAFDLGARRYFTKPVNLSEMVLGIEEELSYCRK
jgi:two-component system, cell cycle response regulator DivK